MSRKPVIAGNWKMFKSQAEVISTVEDLRELVEGTDDVEVVV